MSERGLGSEEGRISTETITDRIVFSPLRELSNVRGISALGLASYFMVVWTSTSFKFLNLEATPHCSQHRFRHVGAHAISDHSETMPNRWVKLEPIWEPLQSRCFARSDY